MAWFQSDGDDEGHESPRLPHLVSPQFRECHAPEISEWHVLNSRDSMKPHSVVGKHPVHLPTSC